MDCVKIDNLEVFCHHGVLKEENVLGQKFLVSLELYTNTRKAGKTDELNYAIDYSVIAQFVDEYMKKNTFKLIEAVAENIACELLLRFELIEKIKVEIKKPWAPIMLPVDYVSVTIERGWTQVYLSIGANEGDREENIKNAIDEIKNDCYIKDIECSSIIETEPYGYVEQDAFLNGAIMLKTLYSPEDLLDRLHDIEAKGNRKREVHWGPRTIDLDIIFYGDKMISTNDLIVPHVDMANREFVLKPLCEIAPGVVHPVYKKTVKQLLDELEAMKGEE